MFGEEARGDSHFQGEVVVFRVRIATLTNRAYYGCDSEDEILIAGIVEGVEISTGMEEDEENG